MDILESRLNGALEVLLYKSPHDPKKPFRVRIVDFDTDEMIVLKKFAEERKARDFYTHACTMQYANRIDAQRFGK